MVLLILVLMTSSVLVFVACAPQFGGRPKLEEQRQKIAQSANFRNGRFRNLVPTPMGTSALSTVKATVDFFIGGAERVPAQPLPVASVNSALLGKAGADRLRITWLGHSSVLIEMGGHVIVTDPVFSRRASPFSAVGPKRFRGKAPVLKEDLPDIDAVIISHDHYDHLDYKTILALKEKTGTFFVPLGVGAHLRKWGVPDKKIVELDWWETGKLRGLTLVATPARHFSGRGVGDSFKTLWSSWVIQSPRHRIFFGGDSGYFEGFKEIGEKYGPFDVTMLESGAYSKYWPNIHMMPEETVQAHLDLKGKSLLPIHWAKFNLSLHAWTEPIERLTKEAKKKDVQVATPKIGEMFLAGAALPREPWW